jgi:polyribonucleotide nucleotidyltransferase
MDYNFKNNLEEKEKEKEKPKAKANQIFQIPNNKLKKLIGQKEKQIKQKKNY